MLRDSGKTTMNSAKTAVTTEKPVMLCRLCHCEFTNFKEHVKSLVHLDARETKSTTTQIQASKHKSTNDSNGESPKRIKTEAGEKSFDESERNDSKDRVDESKDVQDTGSSKFQDPSEDQLYSPTTAYLEDESSNMSQEQDNSKRADLNGSSTAKPENEEEPHLMLSARDLKEFSRSTGIKLTDIQISSLVKTWRCKLCGHIHRTADESFDEHVESIDHQLALERKLKTMKEAFKYRTSYKWLMNCLACSFFTNDKDLFISHVQSPQHEKNITTLLGNPKEPPHVGRRCTCFRSVFNTSEEPSPRKVQENTNPTSHGNRTKNNLKPSPPQENKSTASTPYNKKVAPAKPPPKTTFPKPFIEKSQGNSAPKNATPSTVKSNPTPLMSLSLPGTLSQNQSRWQPPSTVNRNPPSVTRNQVSVPRNPLLVPPNYQPGILGEYRPPIAPAKFGLKNEGTFDLISQSLMGAPSAGVVAGRPVTVGVGRAAYPEVNRDSYGSRISYDVESYGSVFGSDKYDSHVWAGLNSAPTEKLNSLAFGRVEPDPPPSSEFDALSKLLTQQPGLLPSNVSLDLASNSSIRYKFNSDRGAMFDNYPASRPDLSRNDFPRHDLPRSNNARNDVSSSLFSRPMFSRR